MSEGVVIGDVRVISRRKGDLRSGITLHIALPIGEDVPTIGGVRLSLHDQERDARLEAARLATAMRRKAWVSGVPFDGAKAVLNLRGEAAKLSSEQIDSLYEWVGEELGLYAPLYGASWDVGMTLERFHAMSVHCSRALGVEGMAGSPGVETARGVFHAMVAATRALEQPCLSPYGTVFVQGLGATGMALVRLLREHDAQLGILVYDPVAERMREAVTQHGVIMAGSEHDFFRALQKHRGDVPSVFAPCALGGALTAERIRALPPGTLVCGAANNQFADPALGPWMAHWRHVVCVPDVLANLGGLSWMALEALVREDVADANKLSETFSGDAWRVRAWIEQRIMRLVERLIRMSALANLPPNEMLNAWICAMRAATREGVALPRFSRTFNPGEDPVLPEFLR